MADNAIGPTGLTIQSYQDILDEILNGTADFPGMLSIYGNDINIDANSPDGQMLNIVAQAKLDLLHLVQQVYNSFDPDQAIGTVLNARCAINGIIRNAGTFTQQTVTVTATQTISLTGLSDDPNNAFTVSDAVGNQYQLISTYSFSSAGSSDLLFQAKQIGPVSSVINTITNIVTVLLGISSVNNPDVAEIIGTNEESDFAFRIRRQKSVALPNKGYLEGLVSGLINVAGVSQAVVYENDTGTTDAHGIPGHSIWVIVRGGTDADVAQAIYVKRNAGCGMWGSVIVSVEQVDGSFFPITFSRPVAANLWISFNVSAIGSGSVDPTYIRTQLLAQLSYNIAQPADTTTIVTLIRSIAPAASVSSEGVSADNVTYSSLLATTSVNNQWALASSRIIINGSAGP